MRFGALCWPLEAAPATSVRSATLESPAAVFAAVGEVIVVFVLPRVSAPVVVPVVVPFVVAVLGAAAASGTLRTAAAATSVASVVSTVRAVFGSVPMIMPVWEFLALCSTSRSDAVTGSGTGHGMHSDSNSDSAKAKTVPGSCGSGSTTLFKRDTIRPALER